MSSIRKRKFTEIDQKGALKLVKELDAFPKVPDSYQKEKSVSGGGISLLTFILIGALIYSEFKYYAETQLKFEYRVDTDYNAKMKINIDIVVAMKCHAIGADVLDVTNQDTHSFGQLTEEPTYFELSPNQKKIFNTRRDINRYLREEYHAIHDLLWMSGYHYLFQELPPSEDNPMRDHDACRLYGTLEINKVAGNFHVTAGKSIPVIPRGHAHLSLMLQEKDYNFSHRINHFSFGDSVAGAINPMDGEELVTKNNYHIYQYFVQIVPTDVKTYKSNVETYQYAVNEKNRSIDHSKGSHGVPGIFVKYDVSPLQIRVVEERRPFWKFLVRLCGIVGGIFAMSGILDASVGYIVNAICCRSRWGDTVNTAPSPSYTTLIQTPPLATQFCPTPCPPAQSDPSLPQLNT